MLDEVETSRRNNMPGHATFNKNSHFIYTILPHFESRYQTSRIDMLSLLRMAYISRWAGRLSGDCRFDVIVLLASN